MPMTVITCTCVTAVCSCDLYYICDQMSTNVTLNTCVTVVANVIFITFVTKFNAYVTFITRVAVVTIEGIIAYVIKCYLHLRITFLTSYRICVFYRRSLPFCAKPFLGCILLIAFRVRIDACCQSNQLCG